MALRDCSEEEVQNLLLLFKTLSNETRLRIARLICRKPRYSYEIEEHFPCDRTNITKHLNILKNAGIIEVQREGRKSLYVFRPGFVRKHLECMDPLKYGLQEGEEDTPAPQ